MIEPTAYSREIANELAALDIDKEAPIAHQVAGTMLLLSVAIGPRRARLKAMVRWGKTLVSPIERRFRQNGIWLGKTVCHSGWDEEETGGCAFLLDVLCGSGELRRSA